MKALKQRAFKAQFSILIFFLGILASQMVQASPPLVCAASVGAENAENKIEPIKTRFFKSLGSVPHGLKLVDDLSIKQVLDGKLHNALGRLFELTSHTQDFDSLAKDIEKGKLSLGFPFPDGSSIQYRYERSSVTGTNVFHLQKIEWVTDTNASVTLFDEPLAIGTKEWVTEHVLWTSGRTSSDSKVFDGEDVSKFLEKAVPEVANLPIETALPIHRALEKANRQDPIPVLQAFRPALAVQDAKIFDQIVSAMAQHEIPKTISGTLLSKFVNLVTVEGLQPKDLKNNPTERAIRNIQIRWYLKKIMVKNAAKDVARFWRWGVTGGLLLWGIYQGGTLWSHQQHHGEDEKPSSSIVEMDRRDMTDTLNYFDSSWSGQAPNLETALKSYSSGGKSGHVIWGYEKIKEYSDKMAEIETSRHNKPAHLEIPTGSSNRVHIAQVYRQSGIIIVNTLSARPENHDSSMAVVIYQAKNPGLYQEILKDLDVLGNQPDMDSGVANIH